MTPIVVPPTCRQVDQDQRGNAGGIAGSRDRTACTWAAVMAMHGNTRLHRRVVFDRRAVGAGVGLDVDHRRGRSLFAADSRDHKVASSATTPNTAPSTMTTSRAQTRKTARSSPLGPTLASQPSNNTRPVYLARLQTPNNTGGGHNPGE